MVCKSRPRHRSSQLCVSFQDFFSLVSQLLPDEDDANDKTLMYYVNDGVYGSFNCILYDHAHVKPVLQKVCLFRNTTYQSHIMGVGESLSQQSLLSSPLPSCCQTLVTYEECSGIKLKP